MKLILTDYIASLKEEQELDSLIEQILREFGFEVVFSPKKGERQYGVDIYAVGEDWEDGIRKVFLITVKQGNLDRKNWESGIQAIQPSLQNIATVFARNNIMPEHVDLPIKIVVAHNGVNDAAIQQNWRGFADMFPQFSFAIWQLETIANLVHERLMSENIFSDSSKRTLRKIIINLSDPSYDLLDFAMLLDEILQQVDFDKKNRRVNLNLLRKANLLTSIVIAYCQEEEDLRLALKASEVATLKIWQHVGKGLKDLDNEYLNEFIRMLAIRRGLHNRYLSKYSSVIGLKNGLGIKIRDAVSYCFTVYEHLGFIAIAGLEFHQMAEHFSAFNKEVSEGLLEEAKGCTNLIIDLYNNNSIAFAPRADNQIIEISLVFLLFHLLGRNNDIKDLLRRYEEEIGQAKTFSNIAPHFHNNSEEIFELDVDYGKRKDFDYQSSNLLPILIEWTIILEDPKLYGSYRNLIKTLFEKIDLILWFPDKETEELLYKGPATQASGYSLSHIVLTDTFEEYKQITLSEYVNNCEESNFSFFDNVFPVPVVGLIACRHYRTYPFPHYWRQLIRNTSDFPKSS